MNEHDPLGFDSFDPNDVDTSRPLLPAGDHHMKVKSVERVESKKQPGKFNLVLQLETAEPVQVDDRVINPGFVISRYYPLQQSENPAAPDYRVDLVKLIDGVLGTKPGERPTLGEAVLLMPGRSVMATISVRKPKPGSEEEQYGDSNEIRKLSPVA